jgi:hypothetical protein
MRCTTNVWDWEASGKVLLRISGAPQAALQTTARGDSAVAMQVARWLFPELHADASAWNVVLLDGHMCGRQAVDKLEVHRSSCYNVVLEFVSQLTWVDSETNSWALAHVSLCLFFFLDLTAFNYK